jgi:hypothetical protein
MKTIIILILTTLVILTFLYLSVRTEPGYFLTVPTSKPNSPKDELIQYFADNWARLAPLIIRKDCDNENIPSEIIYEFKNKFSHYFTNKAENSDPMLKHYSNNTFERTFKMEFNEMCKTLKSLGEYIQKKPITQQAVSLKDLGKEIERLHTEHFPQAVFISIILDRMLQVCNKYPEYNIDQIVNTHDLLTTTIIFYLVMPTKYW